MYVYNEAGNKLGERTCLSSFKLTPEISQGSGSGRQLATLTSEVDMEEYHDHLTLLKLLKDKWANGENVSLSSSSICKSLIPCTCLLINLAARGCKARLL